MRIITWACRDNDKNRTDIQKYFRVVQKIRTNLYISSYMNVFPNQFYFKCSYKINHRHSLIAFTSYIIYPYLEMDQTKTMGQYFTYILFFIILLYFIETVFNLCPIGHLELAHSLKPIMRNRPIWSSCGDTIIGLTFVLANPPIIIILMPLFHD